VDRYTRVTVAVVIAGIVLAAALGYYFATVTATPVVTAPPKTGPFRLMLIEPMNSAWNTTTAQPKFYVVGNKGLESSANISLPVKTLIEVTIVSYDTPTAGSQPQQGLVNGTIGGTVYMINGTTASMSSAPMPWGENVTSVPAASLAHTFTIPQLGINIPVVGGDTEIAYLYFNKAGTYQWFCLTPCGLGPDGMEGAMATPGWMTGTVIVS
jgi:heme/copper-type cytochrome/quinol oxidase subunit 2